MEQVEARCSGFEVARENPERGRGTLTRVYVANAKPIEKLADLMCFACEQAVREQSSVATAKKDQGQQTGPAGTPT